MDRSPCPLRDSTESPIDIDWICFNFHPQFARTRQTLAVFMRDLSLPFGTIEAKDEGEEVVLHPYVPSTPSDEFRRSHATQSSFRKKKPPPRTAFTAAQAATCIG
jgi:hypothetical protein